MDIYQFKLTKQWKHIIIMEMTWNKELVATDLHIHTPNTINIEFVSLALDIM